MGGDAHRFGVGFGLGDGGLFVQGGHLLAGFGLGDLLDLVLGGSGGLVAGLQHGVDGVEHPLLGAHVAHVHTVHLHPAGQQALLQLGGDLGGDLGPFGGIAFLGRVGAEHVAGHLPGVGSHEAFLHQFDAARQLVQLIGLIRS